MNTSLNNIESTLSAHSGYIDNIESNQTDGSQVCKIMGSEDATTSGTQHQLHLDGNGNVQSTIVNTVNVAPANTVNSGITDDPANSYAVGLKGRETITDSSTEKFLQCNGQGRLLVDVVELAQSGAITSSTALSSVQICGFNSGDSRFKTLKCDTDGVLSIKAKQDKAFSSEIVYVSGQSVSGMGSYTGATIVVEANQDLFMVEHNFSNTNMTYNVESSIDGTTWFALNSTPFNSGTPVLSNLEILASSMNFGTGFPPYIRFVITNNDASAQTATLSYVVKSN
jgi:hypothetical protein